LSSNSLASRVKRVVMLSEDAEEEVIDHHNCTRSQHRPQEAECARLLEDRRVDSLRRRNPCGERNLRRAGQLALRIRSATPWELAAIDGTKRC
jgi:predicted neutral ceramidase superfamily lipid hydrolase